jgi:hypothetical protein
MSFKCQRHDVLLIIIIDISFHQNVSLTDVTVSDNLTSHHLPIIFQILDHVTACCHLTRAEKFRDWELFQSLAFKLISPSTKTNSCEEVKANLDFRSSIASAYRMSIRKINLSDLHIDVPGLDRLPNHKHKLR